MDGSWHAVTKYINDKKVHFSHQNFQCMCFTNDQLFDKELAESEIEHREPPVVVILQFAELRMLEIHSYFLKSAML